MKRKHGLLLLMTAAVIAASIGGLILATRGQSVFTDVAPMQGNWSIAQAKNYDRFPLYDAGDNVAGYPLTAIQHDVQGGEVVTFLYGDCIPPQDALGSYDGGCPPPVQVQVWPACKRNPASYTQDMLSPIGDKQTVRGVPAASYEGGRRLEVQTGTSTVVIFADAELVPQVTDALEGVNNKVPAHVTLPAPAAGAMSGKLSC